MAEMQRAVEADDIQSLVKIAELVNEISYSMRQLPKPVVMSVDGPVAGAAANMVVAAVSVLQRIVLVLFKLLWGRSCSGCGWIVFTC